MDKILFGVAALLALVLAGCAIGIKTDGSSPSATFTAPVAYEAAYRSAVNQARLCLRGKEAYDVKSQINAAGQLAVVRVVAPLTGRDVARVDIKGMDSKSSTIHVAMWGKSIWDDAALRAIQDAILYDFASCTAYMPRGTGPAAPGAVRP